MLKLKELIEAINSAAEAANQTIADSKEKIIDQYFFQEKGSNQYAAKTISLSYPVINAEGDIDKIKIDVPLITLVPISVPAIEELRFSTNLEVAIENDQLMVSFSPEPSGKVKGLNAGGKQFAQLDLIIKPQEKTQGLNKLIEGYEKLLRSQIPG